MKHLVLFSLIIFYAPVSLASGLGISPKRVVFKSGQRVYDVVLVNSGETRKKFEISVVNKAMNEQGHLVDTDEPA